ncbi:MAG: hypothetical protein GY711_00500 [bacterium]|nr:hypothetical protein [bacterium]
MRDHPHRWRLCLLLALAACGGSEAPPEPEETHTAAPLPGHGEHADYAPRVLFLGDGLCDAGGVAPHESFLGQVRLQLAREGCIFRPHVECLPGRRTDEALAVLEAQLSIGPNIVVLAIGRADADAGRPIEDIRADLSNLVERARKSGAHVLLLGRTAPGDGRYPGLFESVYSAYAERSGVTLVPRFDGALNAGTGLVGADGGPSAAGHERLAEALAPTLRAVIEAFAGK